MAKSYSRPALPMYSQGPGKHESQRYGKDSP
jgi:hypothetical protein